MGRIALTAEQRRQLDFTNGIVEFTNSHGEVLGIFTRKNEVAVGDPGWPSSEELDRIEQSGVYYTAEQVEEMMRKYAR